MKLAWLDDLSAMQSIPLPQTPVGRLTVIDISWRDSLMEHVVKFVLHHAGLLKSLKAAGKATRLRRLCSS
jgi:hypothetical protein